MSRYNIILSKHADKFLDSLSYDLKVKIFKQIKDLENFPFLTLNHDIAKLKGKSNYYRLRIGNIRIILKIDKDNKIIIIEKIGYRGNIYK